MPPTPSTLLCLPPLARPLGSTGAPLFWRQGSTLMDSRQGDGPLALPLPHSLSLFPRLLVHALSSLFLMLLCFFFLSCQLIFIFFFFFLKKNGKL